MFHPHPGRELQGRARSPNPGLPGGGRRQGGLNQAGLGAWPGPCGFIIAGERSQKSLAGALGDEVSTTRPTKPPATSLIALGPSCLLPPVQLSPDQSSQSRQWRGQGRAEKSAMLGSRRACIRTSLRLSLTASMWEVIGALRASVSTSVTKTELALPSCFKELLRDQGAEVGKEL